MSPKRTPVAEIGADDYRIVRHTHDIELAEKLMRDLLTEEAGEPYTGDLSKTRLEWMRIVPCLPGSYGEGNGWRFEYQLAVPESRGAFRAVVFE